MSGPGGGVASLTLNRDGRPEFPDRTLHVSGSGRQAMLSNDADFGNRSLKMLQLNHLKKWPYS